MTSLTSTLSKGIGALVLMLLGACSSAYTTYGTPAISCRPWAPPIHWPSTTS